MKKDPLELLDDAPLLIVAIGAGLLASSLTPDLRGPGWLAFGGVYLVAWLIALIVRAWRR